MHKNVSHNPHNRFHIVAIALLGMILLWGFPLVAAAQNTRLPKAAPNKQETSSPNDFITAMERLRTAYSQDQNASALTYCKQAMDAMTPETSLNTRLGVMMMCFVLYDKNEQHEEALKLGKEIKQLDMPQDQKDSLCFMEATTFTKLHRWEEARLRYQDCLGHTDQEKAVVQSNVAELSMIQGDPETAANAYRQSLAYSKDNPHAAFGYAIALSRLENWDEAHRAFLDGVQMDPTFSFLKDAFFEPKEENDYQTGYRMYELGRYKEAIFYLNRYVEFEQRSAYRTTAQKLLTKLENAPFPLVATYPVLPDNIRAIALQNDAQHLVFANLNRESADQFYTGIWVMDLQNDKVWEQQKIPNHIITATTFISDTSQLRILATNSRYEIDIDHPETGIYIFENSPEILSLALSPQGHEIIGISTESQLSLSPWENPYLQVPLLPIPIEARRFGVSGDHQSIVLATALKTLFVDANSKEIQSQLPAPFDVEAIAAHPTKNMFALGISSGVLFVNAKGDILRLLGTKSPVKAISFANSGDKCAVLTDQSAEIWDISSLRDIFGESQP